MIKGLQYKCALLPLEEAKATMMPQVLQAGNKKYLFNYRFVFSAYF